MVGKTLKGVGALEFTGERYIPTLDSPEISYEHWHRYLYASGFSEGRTVLDLACGEGYGSNLLSLNAQTVIGVDISQETINHAASKYIRDNLEFKVGSAGSIPIEGTEIFDLIVSFETIEHISDNEQHAFMAEVKRLLKKGGMFIVSTPNRLSYTDLPRYQNQFHVREFYVHEFKDFLRQYFPHVSLLGQKIFPVSYIWSPSTNKGQMREYRLNCTENGFRPTGEEKEILYVLGLCSLIPRDVDTSVLVDLNETIFKLKAQRIGELESALRGSEVHTAKLETGLKERDARIGDRSAQLANLEAGVSARDARIGDLSAQLANLEAGVSARDARIGDLSAQLANLEAGVSARDARIGDLERARREREAYIQHVHAGHGWRLLTKYFKIRDRLLPQGTKRRVFAKNIFHAILSAGDVLGRISKTNIRQLVYLNTFQSLKRQNRLIMNPLSRNLTPGAAEDRRCQPAVPPSILENSFDHADTILLREDGRRVLVVDHRIPTPDQDAGSARMYAILKLLRELDYAVTFVSNCESQMLDYERKLGQLGVPVLYGYSTAVTHLTQYGHQYEFVLLSRPETAFRFLPVVRAYALNSTVIYDTVDLHWVRMRREAEMSGDPALRNLADRFMRIERLNSLCADLVLAVTPDEKESLLAEAPDARVEVIPTIHTSRPPSDLGHKREGLMFIGGFEHVPNVDAVKWFVEEVFPIIQRQLAGLQFHVIGSKMPEQVTVLASPSVRIVGYVPDPEPYFRSSRVFVAPLRYGAGMKGKIGHSMSYGLPVVTTSVGAEGMMLQDGENALIGDGPEAFARAVVRLYTDDRLWRQIADNSVEHIRHHFSEEAVKAHLRTILAGVNGVDRAGTSSQERAA
jgi:SAM-dependent methyltransferase